MWKKQDRLQIHACMVIYLVEPITMLNGFKTKIKKSADIKSIWPLKGDIKVNKGKRIKILTLSKLLTRLSVSYKQKTEIE